MEPDASLEPMHALLARLPPPVQATMVRMYRDALGEQLALVRAALDGSDAAALQATAHKIAGSAAMMQDRELSLAARAIEAAAVETDLPRAGEGWQQLQDRALATLAGLASRYPQPG